MTEVNVANEEHLAAIAEQANLMVTMNFDSKFITPEIKQAYLDLNIAALKLKLLFALRRLELIENSTR